MNTLIISTFSCTFEEFKNDVTTLFLEEMCKDFVTDYEFVKVNDHKSHPIGIHNLRNLRYINPHPPQTLKQQKLLIYILFFQ